MFLHRALDFVLDRTFHDRRKIYLVIILLRTLFIRVCTLLSGKCNSHKTAFKE